MDNEPSPNYNYPQPPKKKPKVLKYLLVVLVLVVCGYIGYRIYRHFSGIITDSTPSISNIPVISTGSTDITDTTPPPTPTPPAIPSSGIIKMAFTTQAPFANWDALHEEACEEASLIMVHHYVQNTAIDSPTSAEKEIQDLVAWETANGYAVDVTVAQLSEIASKHYGMTTGRVVHSVTVDSIKKEIVAGRPVIIPAAGKILPNPNFKDGGPNYHMLVVKGYDANGFITNDPGTRLGENFRYTYDALINAIHDWDPGNILNGQKAFLVFD